MKKTFRLRDIDCANCAAKMETAIQKIDGVRNASINFIAEKLTIEAEDEQFDAIVKEAAKVCRKIEPDCTVVL